MQQTVNVRALPDRIARVSPRGPFIPSDAFVTVPATAYIRRLIQVHGDIEIEPAKAPKAEAKRAEIVAPETKAKE